MPTTLTAAVVMVVLLVPGIIGESIYSRAVRSDRDRNDILIILRVVMVSALGLIVYMTLSQICGLPYPSYLSRDIYNENNLEIVNHNTIKEILLPYMGHIVLSTIIGIIGVPLSGLVRALFGQSPYDSAWDAFCLSFARTPKGLGRWVQVTLIDGRLIIGILRAFDVYDKDGDRDIVLEEPEYWNDITQEYEIYPIQSIFLSAGQISAIGVLYDESLDARETRVPEQNEPPSENRDEEQHSVRQAESPTSQG